MEQVPLARWANSAREPINDSTPDWALFIASMIKSLPEILKAAEQAYRADEMNFDPGRFVESYLANEIWQNSWAQD